MPNNISQTSRPSRKWGIGLGILAALSIISLYKFCPARKTKPSQKPPASAPKALPGEDAGFRRPTWVDLAEYKRKMGISLPESEKEKSAPLPINDLKDFFDHLKNDSPIPIIDIEDTNIKIETEYICVDKPGYAGIAAIYNQGELMGYFELGCIHPACIKIGGMLSSGIRDAQGELIGFREQNIHLAPKISFFTRGGKATSIKEDSPDPEGNIFKPKEAFSLGRYNAETGQFENSNGEIIGEIDSDNIYLLLSNAPSCEIEFGETNNEAAFIRFSSWKEYIEFKKWIAWQISQSKE